LLSALEILKFLAFDGDILPNDQATISLSHASLISTFMYCAVLLLGFWM